MCSIPQPGTGIVATTILFRPDMEKLRDDLALLQRLGFRTALFDNTPAPSPVSLASLGDADRSVILLQPGRNEGLARGYNTVVSRFLDDPQVEGFLLLDQDSVLQEASLRRLVATYRQARMEEHAGVVGGRPVVEGTTAYRIRETGETSRIPGCRPCSMVISSFSIVSPDAFREAGMFAGDFFIDHIDVDFCLRVRRAGLAVLMDERATFPHRIGSGALTLFNRTLTPVSEPFRNYFQVRNGILSLKRSGAPCPLLALQAARKIGAVLLQGVAAGSLPLRLRCACRGAMDGIRGIGGELPHDLRHLLPGGGAA